MKVVSLLALLWISLAAEIIQPRTGELAPISEESEVAGVAENQEAGVVVITGTKTTSRNRQVDETGWGLGVSSRQVSMGTGFVVSDEGLIVTNKHVVEDNGARYEVTSNKGQKYEVETIWRDPSNDVAVVKIKTNSVNENLPSLALGDSSTVSLGEKVATIGNSPFEKDIVKTGVVAGKRAQVIAGNGESEKIERLRDVIQTNLNLVPGNSGSPLLNKEGEVIGINTATSVETENMSFALPINQVKEFIKRLRGEKL